MTDAQKNIVPWTYHMQKAVVATQTLNTDQVVHSFTTETVLLKIGKFSMRFISLIIACFTLTGCYGYPKAVSPIMGFDLEKYTGRWYEIARLDHSFERGMERVTADYRIREDGLVEVVNRGYSPDTGKWKEAVGKASFVRTEDEGYLKVSFWGPFYSSYVIFGIDRENYQYAYVSGPTDTYLWLLARTPTVDQQIKEQFLAAAREKGFRTEELIFVHHQ